MHDILLFSTDGLQQLAANTVQHLGGELVIVKGTADLVNERQRLGLVPLAENVEQLVVNGTRSLQVAADTVPDGIPHGIDHVAVACGVTDPFGVIVGVVPALGIVGVITPMKEAGSVVLVAHPHGQTAGRQGQVDDAVHAVAAGEAAGVDPHGLAAGLEALIVLDVLLIDRLLDHPNIAGSRQLGGLHGVVDDDPGDALAADARQGAIGQAVGELGLVHQALHIVLLPAVALDALVGAGEVDLQLAVALDGGDGNISVPQKEMIGVVPNLEAGHEATHDVLEAVSQSTVAHHLGGGEIEVHYLPLLVSDGGTRGDHEVVVAHIDLVVQIAIQDLHVLIGIGLHLVIVCQAAVVDPVDHMERGVCQGGDLDVVDLDRNGHGQGLVTHTDGEVTCKHTNGSIGGHVDTDIEGGTSRLGLPLVNGSGDLVNVEGRLAGDEVLHRIVIGGAEHLGVAVQGHRSGQELVDGSLTALHGKIGGDCLAALQCVVGQHLEADVGPAGSIQLGSIGASQLSVGINPLIFRKYLAFHRLNPFVVDL